MVGCWRGIRTPRSSRPSSLWRGMMVTSSISHRNAISGGVSPGGRGNAMLRRVALHFELLSRLSEDAPRKLAVLGLARSGTSPYQLISPILSLPFVTFVFLHLKQRDHQWLLYLKCGPCRVLSYSSFVLLSIGPNMCQVECQSLTS